MKLLLLGVAIAIIVFLATSGHVLFLPLILVLPLGFLFRGGSNVTSATEPGSAAGSFRRLFVRQCGLRFRPKSQPREPPRHA
jgi:hypothetical protein